MLVYLLRHATMRLCCSIDTKIVFLLLDLGKEIITLNIVTGLSKDTLDGAADRSKYCRLHFHSGELEKCLTFLNFLTNFDVAIDQDTGHRAADGPLVGRVALLPPNLAGTSGTSHEFRGEGIGSSNEPLLAVDDPLLVELVRQEEWHQVGDVLVDDGLVDGLELRRAQVLGRQEQVLGPQRERRRRGEERREELVNVARWRRR